MVRDATVAAAAVAVVAGAVRCPLFRSHAISCTGWMLAPHLLLSIPGIMRIHP